ncbi:MAG: redoxin domain-containing protein [Xanthomonadales bacterium]|nr:redoxin domain-containing protein [Xanthomonadales bacterium]
MIRTLTVLSLALAASTGFAAVSVGEPAPNFTLTDANGQSHQLSDFPGKTVVLEWTNADCPFVKKHYGATNMQSQQGKWTGEEVVWLTVNSSAAGKQGHVDGAGANAVIAATGGKQSAYLLDAPGDVGRAYGAKTTPHMYVIDGQGVLRYNGAIDSIASADKGDIVNATQYVDVALTQLAAGEAVATSVTQPYGCSVKY